MATKAFRYKDQFWQCVITSFLHTCTAADTKTHHSSLIKLSSRSHAFWLISKLPKTNRDVLLKTQTIVYTVIICVTLSIAIISSQLLSSVHTQSGCLQLASCKESLDMWCPCDALQTLCNRDARSRGIVVCSESCRVITPATNCDTLQQFHK